MSPDHAVSLSIRDLRTGYGSTRVLNGLSMDVEPGEVVGLIGSNGVGKTTALRAVVGQLPAWSGSIVVDGKDLSKIPAHHRIREGVSMVPEGRQVFKELTAAENVYLGAYFRQDKRGIDSDFQRMLELFPVLGDRRNQLGGQLSGGEQQMVALARALMARPKLLLLDEPSLGLAPKVVDAVFELIPEIRDEGISLVLVEQNARRALEVSDRAYVMSRGAIALSGTSQDLMEDETVRSVYLGFGPSGHGGFDAGSSADTTPHDVRADDKGGS